MGGCVWNAVRRSDAACHPNESCVGTFLLRAPRWPRDGGNATELKKRIDAKSAKADVQNLIDMMKGGRADDDESAEKGESGQSRPQPFEFAPIKPKQSGGGYHSSKGDHHDKNSLHN